MTDVVHIARRNLLLILFTCFYGKATGFFVLLFFASYPSWKWIALSLLLVLYHVEHVWLPVIQYDAKETCVREYFSFLAQYAHTWALM